MLTASCYFAWELLVSTELTPYKEASNIKQKMIMLIHKTLSAYCLWGLMANGLFWSGLPMRDFFFFFGRILHDQANFRPFNVRVFFSSSRNDT